MFVKIFDAVSRKISIKTPSTHQNVCKPQTIKLVESSNNITIFIPNSITLEKLTFFLSKINQLCRAHFTVENMVKITSGTH